MEALARICLVHYHEIGLKGHNRSTFEMRLVKNIQALISAYPVASIKRISGRLCVTFNDDADYATTLACTELIRKVPGVARVSCGLRCERDIAVMNQVAVKVLGEAGPFETFKVAARRNHTDFPIDSMEMNRVVGAALCDAFPAAVVRMKEPDIQVGVEVVQNATYIYAKSIPGIGGLPVGSSGKVMCLLSSGIDSPVALWRVARRGAICIGVHFSGRPQTTTESEYLVDDIARVLEASGCIAKVYVVPLGDYQREIALTCPPSLRIVLYRRLMFKVAQALALREGAQALVTGESLGQVASQTLENIAATNAAVGIPVLRPLIGSDKLEIIDAAQKLGTFDISSQPAPDCCTLFMPRKPETHARMEEVLAAEAAYPLDEWVAALAESAEAHLYACPSYHGPRQ